MRRILIMGPSGSGKSTLARQLGERLGLEVVHLDRLYWRPGWSEPPVEEFGARLAPVVQRESWIIEGNYWRTGTLTERLERADTIIYLDLGRLPCMVRVLRRTFRTYGRTRPDTADECPERFNLGFMWYVWTEPGRQKILMPSLEPWLDTKVRILRGTHEVRRFLEETHPRPLAVPGVR